MCHQTVGLTAHHLESIGTATVIIGSARDIIEELGVPRFLFTDLPLGNPVGPPDDPDRQRRVLLDALELGASAVRARTTVQSRVVWTGSPEWRDSFMSTDDTDELQHLGDARRARQAAEKRDQSPS